ncbi:hypothetical protein FACS1894192_10620 [Bacilli bacterium]|nr:hypothetical protein FACS1894192_10620 [Bacilli bacterium]GHU45283.1 hypothetical protein FACS1894194_0710 [Bacilli bacterium]
MPTRLSFTEIDEQIMKKILLIFLIVIAGITGIFLVQRKVKNTVSKSDKFEIQKKLIFIS